jgi:thioredoxin 1
MKSPFLFSLLIPVVALVMFADHKLNTPAATNKGVTVNNEIKGGGAAEFNDKNFESKVLKSDKLTVVDFWAEWCGPCRKVGPVIEQLAKEYDGKVNIGKLNVDFSPNTCQQYGITSIPTLLFIKNGKVVDKLIGAYPKSEYAKKIKAHM